MKQQRMLGVLIIVAHWIAAVCHLFIVAKVMPGVGDNVRWVAISLLTVVHGGISIIWWRSSDRLAGLVLCAFLLVAIAFGTYEHFLSTSANNFLQVARSGSGVFRASVLILMALEIVGCWLGARLSLRGGQTIATL